MALRANIKPDNLANHYWRLNNLYYILDEDGNKVIMKLNENQEIFYHGMHYWNVILKSRQLGFTTFIDVFALDRAIFNDNQTIGIIADTRENAKKIFRKKIKFPYDNLPPEFRQARELDTENTSELIFNNGSSITVGTSFRGDTCNLLHVSEFGKICAKTPEKAKEIVTGSFNTVHAGNMCFLESTAEGRSGYFFDYCEKARKAQLSGLDLTKRSFKFFFFPWFNKEKNSLPEEEVDLITVTSKDSEYFQDLEDKYKINLTKNQKAWYVETLENQGDEMFREHPSTPEEAFKSSIEGAYYKSQFLKVYKEGRICAVPYRSTRLVDTWWDLGMDDATAIWFTQDDGFNICFIDYFQHSGEGFDFYKDILDEKGYRYGRHTGPHDLKVRELGTSQSRVDAAFDLGIRFDVAPKPNDKIEAIEKVRSMFPSFWFDAEKTAEGVAKLEAFRKDWDEKRQVFRKQPLHDENIHAADALQTLCLGHSPRRLRNTRARKIIARRF